MYQCDICGEIFDEYESGTERICLESEYGVAGMFPDMHYQDIMVCPACGSREFSRYYEDEDETE